MRSPRRLAGTLVLAMAFFAPVRPESGEPCVEVVPNITYECMERNLYTIPRSIPSSAKNLDLSFNPLMFLDNQSFSSFPELEVLDLSRCEIQAIEDDAYAGLHYLSTLILTGNPIQNLAPRAFAGLVSLQKLVAVEINLTSLENFPIGHLQTLRELNVAHNLIHSFKLPEYFSNLTTLEYLDLSNNRIQTIYRQDLHVLYNMPKLSLDLSLNPIDSIQPGAFDKLRLQGLTLRSNFDNTSVMKTCIQGLSGLEVRQLVLGEFKDERNMKVFDKSALEGLCDLTIEKFRLAYLQDFPENIDGFFNCLVNVSAVSLANVHLSSLGGLPKDLKWESLELVKCKVKEFPTVKIPSLKRYSFTASRGADSFSDVTMKSLEFLDLSRNGMSYKGCCSHQDLKTPRLKYLNLSYNGVITMTANFMGLELLESLDLQHSTLKQTSEFSIFLSLNKLLYLDISYTHTYVAFHGIFSGLVRLEVLKMAGNSFKDNTLSSVFTELSNLTFLDLSKCQLEHISQGVFDRLLRLEFLNLSHNNLLFLDALYFKPLYTLKSLDYSCNKIASSKGQELQHLPSNLTTLNLSKNPFECSCQHQSFLQWIKDKRQLLVEAEHLECAAPPDMQGVLLLSFRNATCQIPKVIIIVTVVSVLVVSVVALLVYKFYFHLMLLGGCKKYNQGENIYDAFVIYSSQDEDWVRNELVKNLEEGVPPFQLCLHYRDFIPGVAIAANIIQEGFHKSRKVIVVVSQHFIQSRWCIFEYEIAQTWQFLSSRAGIIFIVLQKLEKSLLRQQVELYRLLSRNTYLEWEDHALGRHIFWRRLRKALMDGKSQSPKGTENNEQAEIALT